MKIRKYQVAGIIDPAVITNPASLSYTPATLAALATTIQTALPTKAISAATVNPRLLTGFAGVQKPSRQTSFTPSNRTLPTSSTSISFPATTFTPKTTAIGVNPQSQQVVNGVVQKPRLGVTLPGVSTALPKLNSPSNINLPVATTANQGNQGYRVEGNIPSSMLRAGMVAAANLLMKDKFKLQKGVLQSPEIRPAQGLSMAEKATMTAPTIGPRRSTSEAMNTVTQYANNEGQRQRVGQMALADAQLYRQDQQRESGEKAQFNQMFNQILNQNIALENQARTQESQAKLQRWTGALNALNTEWASQDMQNFEMRKQQAELGAMGAAQDKAKLHQLYLAEMGKLPNDANFDAASAQLQQMYVNGLQAIDMQAQQGATDYYKRMRPSFRVTKKAKGGKFDSEGRIKLATAKHNLDVELEMKKEIIKLPKELQKMFMDFTKLAVKSQKDDLKLLVKQQEILLKNLTRVK